MHRAPFLALLQRYAARHPAEAATCRRYTAFVEAHPDCFERHLRAGHVTGAAWVLDKAGARTLLTHHRKLGRWLQLGGHVDGEADVAAAAAREAEEESGIADLELVSPEIFDLDIHPIPARGDEPAHLHYDARFLFRASGSEDFVVSGESIDLAWVPLDRLGDFTAEESILRMAMKTATR